MLILGLIVGVVAPQGYRVYERARAYLGRLEEAGFKKKAAFHAFISDMPCEVTPVDSDMALICKDEEIMRHSSHEKFETVHITHKGYQWNEP